MAERQVDTIHLKLPRGAKEELIELAQRSYLTPTALARMIIMERVDKLRKDRTKRAA